MPAQVAAEADLVRHSQVVEMLAPEGADKTFNDGISPGRALRRKELLLAEGTDGAVEARRIDPVAIPNEKPRCSIVGRCRAQLSRRPRRGAVGTDVHVNDIPVGVGENHEHKRTWKVAVRTVTKSREAIWEAWLRKKVREDPGTEFDAGAQERPARRR